MRYTQAETSDEERMLMQYFALSVLGQPHILLSICFSLAQTIPKHPSRGAFFKAALAHHIWNDKLL